MAVALVTGASSGIGLELAKLFAADGHSVILVARREARLRELADQLIKAHGVRAWVIAMDLATPLAGERLFQETQSLGLEVDFLVNNAAFGTGGTFAELPLEAELRMIDVNVRSLVEATHHFLKPMLKRRSGHILNVGSCAGFQPGPFMNTYSACKAFVNSFSEALHQELRGTGVSCTLLAPGFTATEFQSAARLDGPAVAKFRHAPSASPAFVARNGYEAMMKGESLKVSGAINFLGLQSLRVAPRHLVRRLVAKMYKAQLS